MSRDIKFRAYVEKINKIVNVDKINFEDKHIVHYFDNLPFPTLVKYSFEEIVLMQYVGMKDNNNKEIYEGDIIKYFDEPTLGIVYYNDSLGSFMIDWKFEYEPNYFNDCDKDQIEIIGNIYDNPELLEVE